MRKEFEELLRQRAGGNGAALKRLDELCAVLVELIAPCSPANRSALLDELKVNILQQVHDLDERARKAHANNVPCTEIPAEIRTWALAHTSEAEVVAGIREVRETGGIELSDFLHELEEIVNTDA